jgi:hypothetical protein
MDTFVRLLGSVMEGEGHILWKVKVADIVALNDSNSKTLNDNNSRALNGSNHAIE